MPRNCTTVPELLCSPCSLGEDSLEFLGALSIRRAR
jgi:hypothetical protein